MVAMGQKCQTGLLDYEWFLLNNFDYGSCSHTIFVVGYEPRSADGERHLALVIALEIDDDGERLKKKELGTIDESIKAALPHTLVGPDIWELYE